MLIRKGGEPGKRGGLFSCNFLATHKKNENFGKCQHRKPFPSYESMRKKRKRAEYLQSLRKQPKDVFIPKIQSVKTFADLPKEFLEFLAAEFFDGFYQDLEKFNRNALFDYLKDLWSLKAVKKTVERLSNGWLLSGVKFYLHGIAQPFIVSARDIKLHIQQCLA